jgi:hypothetical protein
MGWQSTYTEGAARAENLRKSKKLSEARKSIIMATEQASMDTPCDIGLPWVSDEAERLIHQLIEEEGVKGIRLVEERWLSSIFNERARVFSIIRRHFCDPLESMEQGLNRRLGLTLRPSGQYNKSKIYCDQLKHAYQLAWSKIMSGYQRPKEKSPDEIRNERDRKRKCQEHMRKHQKRLIKAGAE